MDIYWTTYKHEHEQQMKDKYNFHMLHIDQLCDWQHIGPV